MNQRWLRRGLQAAVLAGAVIMSGTGVAAADVTSGDLGVGSGNQITAPVTVPINACGNAVAVLGNAEAACMGGSTAIVHGFDDGNDVTSGDFGVVAGNQVTAPLTAPIDVCGNAIAVFGAAEAACMGGATAVVWGGSGSDTTSGDVGLGTGNQVNAPVSAPADGSGQAVAPPVSDADSSGRELVGSPPVGGCPPPPAPLPSGVRGTKCVPPAPLPAEFVGKDETTDAVQGSVVSEECVPPAPLPLGLGSLISRGGECEAPPVQDCPPPAPLPPGVRGGGCMPPPPVCPPPAPLPLGLAGRGECMPPAPLPGEVTAPEAPEVDTAAPVAVPTQPKSAPASQARSAPVLSVPTTERALASTGSDVEGLVPAGLLMMLAGGVATAFARRRVSK